jgi:hypothetical protein
LKGDEKRTTYLREGPIADMKPNFGFSIYKERKLGCIGITTATTLATHVALPAIDGERWSIHAGDERNLHVEFLI